MPAMMYTVCFLAAWLIASIYWFFGNLGEKHRYRAKPPPWEWWAAAPVLFLALCVDLARRIFNRK